MLDRMVTRDYRVKINYTCGDASPSADQRNRIRARLHDKATPTAFICRTLAQRAGVSIISLFVKDPLKAFGADQENEALNWLRIQDRERSAIQNTARRLSAQLGKRLGGS